MVEAMSILLQTQVATIPSLSPETLAILALALLHLALVAILVWFALARSVRPVRTLSRRVEDFSVRLGDNAQALQAAMASLREDTRKEAASARADAAARIDGLGEGFQRFFDAIAQAQRDRLSQFAASLSEARAASDASALALREEVNKAVGGLSSNLVESLTAQARAQTEALSLVQTQIKDMLEANERAALGLRQTVEGKLETLRQDNEAKLEQMRATVDEKLQGTLEQRLGASFTQVNEHLERVFKSVGEMQTIATGVGDLKRVLLNVKSRGTWGEATLGMLLEQAMAQEQYGENVEVRPGSGQRVEFAIRLPGDGESPVWLPIDAKLPIEDYERLIDASERADAAAVEVAQKGLERAIRLAAKDISEKYVCPPFTTDFAIMFLPTEGLFAEVVRRPGLIDALQRDHRVMVAGPTTLMATLVSLRMGFRTLAIQQRSSEVWQVLGAVKQEFGKFGDVLDKVEKKLGEAQKTVHDAGVRRRAVDRKLRDVEILPGTTPQAALPHLGPGEMIEEMFDDLEGEA
jgi:DNA recombination protein RmuC